MLPALRFLGVNVIEKNMSGDSIKRKYTERGGLDFTQESSAPCEVMYVTFFNLNNDIFLNLTKQFWCLYEHNQTATVSHLTMTTSPADGYLTLSFPALPTLIKYRRKKA